MIGKYLKNNDRLHELQEMIAHAESLKGYIRYFVVESNKHTYPHYVVYTETHMDRHPSLYAKVVHFTERIEEFFWDAPVRVDLPLPIPSGVKMRENPFKGAKPIGVPKSINNLESLGIKLSISDKV